MTIPEITAYVMALPVEDVRRLTATEIMGWELKSIKTHNRIDLGPRPVYEDLYCVDGKPYQTVEGWRPDKDRNQSRMVTNRIGTKALMRLYKVFNEVFEWESHWDITPLDESRAALIARMRRPGRGDHLPARVAIPAPTDRI